MIPFGIREKMAVRVATLQKVSGALNASCFLSLALIYILIRNKGCNPEIPGDCSARLYKK